MKQGFKLKTEDTRQRDETLHMNKICLLSASHGSKMFLESSATPVAQRTDD